MTSPTSPFLLSQHYKQHAIAMLSGGETYPHIYGMAIFTDTPTYVSTTGISLWMISLVVPL